MKKEQALVPKPSLTVWQIVTMSFGFLGIQFGFALQNGNTSRILRSFGADVDQLPAFWLVAPVVGMIVQPLIGHYSDRTWNRLGRRKPYFLAGAILSSLALIFLPNSGALSSLVPVLWIGAGMVMVMDTSFNIAMEPFRALVADNLPDKQRTLGFSIQTFLIGLGAVGGSYLPEFLGKHGFSLEAGTTGVADNIRYAFYIGATVFVIAILVTVFCLARLGVLARPFQFFLQSLLARRFGRLFQFEPILLLFQPRTVVAFPGNPVSPVEFQYPLRRIVEKVAVMRDRHHRAGETLQKLFQPIDRLCIQMISRFVQQQHVRPGQQQATQGDAAFLST